MREGQFTKNTPCRASMRLARCSLANSSLRKPALVGVASTKFPRVGTLGGSPALDTGGRGGEGENTQPRSRRYRRLAARDETDCKTYIRALARVQPGPASRHAVHKCTSSCNAS